MPRNPILWVVGSVVCVLVLIYMTYGPTTTEVMSLGLGQFPTEEAVVSSNATVSPSAVPSPTASATPTSTSVPSGTLCAKVFEDVNGDGFREVSEPEFSVPVTVTVVSPAGAIVASPSGPPFCLKNLPIGNYTVFVSVIPAGYDARNAVITQAVRQMLTTYVDMPLRRVTTSTPTPVATRTPTATPTPTTAPTMVKNVVPVLKTESGCAALVGKFSVPRGTPIWYWHNGQFSKSDPMYGGFKGGETLAVPVEERDGRCKTNARSDAAGDWWFSLADVQLPSAPPPAALSQAPAFGQTPVATLVPSANLTSSLSSGSPTATSKCGPLNVVVDGQAEPITQEQVVGYIAAEDSQCKIPRKIQFHWRSDAEILRLQSGFASLAFFVPDDMARGDPRNSFGLSEKGVVNIYLNTRTLGVANSSIAHELCRAVFYYVKGDKTAGGDGYPGSPVVACEKQVAAKYRFASGN